MRRISVQILLSYLPLLLLTAAIGWFAARLLTDLGGAVGLVLAENYRSVLASQRMQSALDLQELARAEGDAAAFGAASTTFETALADAFGAAAVPGESALLDSMATLHDRYRTLALPATGAPPSPLADQLRAQAQRLLRMNQTAILDKNDRAEEEAARARRSLVVAVGLALLLSLAGGLQFARQISRPLQQLTAGVDDVARGQFAARVSTSDGGEVGALATAFNAMARRLQAFEALNVQALVREKRTAESLIEAIPSPVVVTDDAGRLHLHNHAATPLLTSGGDGGVGERTLAEAAPALARALEAAPRRADGTRLADVATGGRDGTFQLRQTHVEVPGADDTQTRLTITLLDDVTPLQALDRARRDFLAAVSHELRTPLTSLGIALDLLLRQYAGALTDDQRDLLATAKGDTDRLKALVSRLLDLARLDVAGLRRGPVDVGAVLETASTGVALAAAARGVSVAVDLPPSLPTLPGDAEALGWAVSNLVVNAVRHAHATVRLAARAEASRLVITVTDDGPGVPAGTEAQVFEPLVQLPPADGVATGSAGLGLTIVRRVAEAHGGEAFARPGPGGHFVLTLPLPS